MIYAKFITATVMLMFSFYLLSLEKSESTVNRILHSYDALAQQADKHLEKNAPFLKKTETLKDFNYTTFKKTKQNLQRFKRSVLFLKKELQNTSKKDLTPQRIKNEKINIKELSAMLEKWAKMRNLAKENNSVTRHVRAALKAVETLRKDLNSFIKERQ